VLIFISAVSVKASTLLTNLLLCVKLGKLNENTKFQHFINNASLFKLLLIFLQNIFVTTPKRNG